MISNRVSSSLSKTMLHLRLSDSAKGGTPSSSNDNNDDTLSIIQQQQILEQQEKLLEQQELILRQQVSRSTSSAASSIPNSIIQSNNINNGNNSNKAMDPLFASMTRIDPTSSELNEGPVTNVPGIGEVPTSQVKFLAAPLVLSLIGFSVSLIFGYRSLMETGSNSDGGSTTSDNNKKVMVRQNNGGEDRIAKLKKAFLEPRNLRSTPAGIGSSYSSTAYGSGESGKENKNGEEKCRGLCSDQYNSFQFIEGFMNGISGKQ